MVNKTGRMFLSRGGEEHQGALFYAESSGKFDLIP
jgi:hypothetical protein